MKIVDRMMENMDKANSEIEEYLKEKNNTLVKFEDLLKNMDESISDSQDVESVSESLEFENDFNGKLMKLVNIMMKEMDKTNSDIEEDLKEISLNLVKIVLKLMKLDLSTQT